MVWSLQYRALCQIKVSASAYGGRLWGDFCAGHFQGLTGRVFQLRVGSGSGIGKNYRVGSGLGSGSGIGNIY